MNRFSLITIACLLMAHPVCAAIFYSEDFEDFPAGGGAHAFEDYGWTVTAANGANLSASVSTPAFVTESSDIQGNYRASLGFSDDRSLFMTTDAPNLQSNTETYLFLEKRDSSLQANSGLRWAVQIEGDWWVQDSLLPHDTSGNQRVTLHYGSMQWVAWPGAPGGLNSPFNAPALGGGSHLPFGMVEKWGILYQSNATSDGTRIDIISIIDTPIPEPTAGGMVFIGAGAVRVLRNNSDKKKKSGLARMFRMKSRSKCRVKVAKRRVVWKKKVRRGGSDPMSCQGQ